MKAEFRTELDAKYLSDREERLQVPLVFFSAILGREITVPAGFVTDYASVPRIPFAYWLFGGIAKEPAVVHDYLYRNGDGVTRAQADAVFREAMGATGQSWSRRQFMWAGVRAFGWTAYAPDELQALD